MDLSDGSDVEGEVDLDQSEENALLGSDDEDSNRLIYEDEVDYHEDNLLHGTEDGDVLDLELNEDEGLGFDDSESQGHNRVAPIKVRPSAVPSRAGSSSYSSNASVRIEEDEDDDDDSRNTRTRFLSERNTEDIHPQSHSNHSMQPSMGNPIQTLGGRAVQTGGDGRPKQQWNNGRPPMQRFNSPQRFPMNRSALLGEGPRPIHAQVRGIRPQSNQPVQQFQGNLFTDFAKPMRSGMHMQQGNQARGIRPGPFQNECNNGGGRPPGMMMRGNRGPLNGPSFPHPMRPRLNHPGPGNMPRNRPPGNQMWRSNRPDMRPNFQGPPNPLGMGGMGMMQPVGPIYSQEPRPPFFLEPGARPDLNPHFNPNVATVQPMQQHMFPNGPINVPGPQPPRIHMVRPEMQPPVQSVQPFFSAPHAQAYLEDPHQHPPNGPGYWPHPSHGGDPNGWGNGPPNYPGPPIQGGPPPRMPPPVEQVMPHHQQQQPHHFNEGPPQMNAPPRNVYEEQTRPQQPYYDQQTTQHEPQQRYPPHQEEHRTSHPSNYEHSHQQHSSRRDDYRHDYERSHRDDSRYHSKRKYEYGDEETFTLRSPEKRLNGRLGPPVKHESSSPARDQKTEELLKIREETNKTIGLDDDYIKKLEEQQKLREQILRRKAEARKKVSGEGSEKVGEPVVSSSTSRPSIYINPKAFRGDLSALNLANVNVIKGSSSGGIVKKSIPRTSTENSGKPVATAATPKTTATSNLPTTKHRTILKIVKDKHGNVISRSKVKDIYSIALPTQAEADVSTLNKSYNEVPGL